MIYWSWARDNAHTTNLSAEHIDTRVCHYPLITLLTYLSIQASWQPTKLHKWPQINPPQGYRPHTHAHTHAFILTPDTNWNSPTRPKLITLLIRTDVPSLQIMTPTINQTREMWGDITEELSWRSAVEQDCHVTALIPSWVCLLVAVTFSNELLSDAMVPAILRLIYTQSWIRIRIDTYLYVRTLPSFNLLRVHVL